MPTTLNDIAQTLKGSCSSQWRWHAASFIDKIPFGKLATYGAIAKAVNGRFGLSINARNVAWLRGYLYDITNRDSTIPLHRVAKKGDEKMLSDSERTRSDGTPLRKKEGTLSNADWWNP